MPLQGTFGDDSTPLKGYVLKRKGKKSKKKKTDPIERLFSCCIGTESAANVEDPDAMSPVVETRTIGYDKFGNLRSGMHDFDREGELARIMAYDSANRADPNEWYIIDACWMAEWLLFVHADVDTAPAPGPVYNHRLIRWCREEKMFRLKEGLVMESAHRVGDYRRVSKETWMQFMDLYPGSGPEISASFPTIQATEEHLAKDSDDEASDDEGEDAATADNGSALTAAGKAAAQAKKNAPEEKEKKLASLDPYRETGKYPTDDWEIGDVDFSMCRTIGGTHKAAEITLMMNTKQERDLEKAKRKKAHHDAAFQGLSTEANDLVAAPTVAGTRAGAGAGTGAAPKKSDDFYNDMFHKDDSDEDDDDQVAGETAADASASAEAEARAVEAVPDSANSAAEKFDML